MKSKDYKLIPMSEIEEEARRIAILWHENATDWIGDKHKLASDIMNYADSYASELKQENETLRNSTPENYLKVLHEHLRMVTLLAELSGKSIIETTVDDLIICARKENERLRGLLELVYKNKYYTISLDGTRSTDVNIIEDAEIAWQQFAAENNL